MDGPTNKSVFNYLWKPTPPITQIATLATGGSGGGGGNGGSGGGGIMPKRPGTPYPNETEMSKNLFADVPYSSLPDQQQHQQQQHQQPQQHQQQQQQQHPSTSLYVDDGKTLTMTMTRGDNEDEKRREREKLEKEVEQLRHHCDVLQMAVGNISNMNRELTKRMNDEKQRADSAIDRMNNSLKTQIGDDLSATQHNLASGFPSVNNLKTQYTELMVTGSRQDLADLLCRIDALLHIVLKIPAEERDNKKTALFMMEQYGVDMLEQYQIRIEVFLGQMIIDIHGAVASLFAQLSVTTNCVIIAALPFTTERLSAVSPTTAKIEDATREYLRSNYASLFEFIRSDRTDRTDRADAKRAKPGRDPVNVEEYLAQASPMVHFAVEKSVSAQGVIEAIIKARECSKHPEYRKGNSESKLDDLTKTIAEAQIKFEKFVKDCLELFWLIQLSVPRLHLYISLDTFAHHYNHHNLIPPKIRARNSPSRIIFPALISATERNTAVKGIAI